MSEGRFWLRASALGGAILLAATACLPADALEPRPGVKLRALDKITGNSTDVTAKAGQTVTFGKLKVTVRACYQSPPEDTPPEFAAYLEVHGASQAKDLASKEAAKVKKAAGDDLLFRGWMFASSPGLSALESPVYDVWVISCSAPAPDAHP